MTDKVLIIYHAYSSGPCPDGHAAAWVAKKKYPTADILGATYDDAVTDCVILQTNLLNYNKIVIVDFSFPKAVLEGWSAAGLTIELIDHHKTALENLSDFMGEVVNPKRKIYFDMQESGATLTWRTYFSYLKVTPVFLKYVKDRDLWEHKLPYTKEIHAAMSALGRTFALYDILEDKTEQELIDLLVPLGSKLLKERQEIVEFIADRFDWATVAGYKGIPLVKIKPGEEPYISDVCQHLYLKYPEALFTACVTNDGKYSLRSNKDGNNTDVGAIAKRFAGGGHHCSAGFSTN
jgi:oligoribonuclease NrnB/cAMP/cGMP phosphodiesterase (DHH superfamily)